ncbi:MAG: prephenate dehydrogenase [Bacilli bacterium]|nr:prephenate dehydrogenase [Bacilli bacterium]
MIDKKTKFLIVGLGLMGGSYAKGLTNAGYYVGAIDIDENSIKFAIEHGYIASGFSKIEEKYISQFDIIVFALYPHTFIDWIKENQQFIKSGALITDVTGVKKSIVTTIQEMLRDDLEFIPSHPMAGREVGGVVNANEKIFLGANYIITPTKKNSEKAIETSKEIGHILGFKNISTLSIEEHDEMIGFLSQLTHCIAVSLMNCKDDAEKLALYSGDSFRDLTRIAKINEKMWTELFLLNKEELLSQMNLFEKEFNSLKKAIENSDIKTMENKMKNSTMKRGFFDKKI